MHPHQKPQIRLIRRCGSREMMKSTYPHGTANNQRTLSTTVDLSPAKKAYRPHKIGIALVAKSAISGSTRRPPLAKRQSNHKASATPSTSVARGVCSNRGNKYTFTTKKKPNSHGIRSCLRCKVMSSLSRRRTPASIAHEPSRARGYELGPSRQAAYHRL